MQAAAELPTLTATCFRCQARFVEPEPASCPGCGGAVILEMRVLGRAHSIVEIPAAAEADPADEPTVKRPSFLPGVHIMAARPTRERLARTPERPVAPRQGGGTSVHASARGRRDSGLALKLVSMAALLATFAFFLQAAH